jgi:hypothetical protein
MYEGEFFLTMGLVFRTDKTEVPDKSKTSDKLDEKVEILFSTVSFLARK